MLAVGLTGGIGSGKSTVAEYFSKLGVPVIDADALARDLVEPGRPALEQIVAVFGPGILDAAGRLDRARLRDRVFTDDEQRRKLESILHPRIRAEITRRISQIHADYCIVTIPLMVETGQADLVNRVLVIDCPQELQRRRIAQRAGWSAAEIDGVIRAQASREARLQTADDIIVNDSDLTTLRNAVESLHYKYRQLSAGTAGQRA